jgi:O-acetyl-ADP-ribose deacetylase
MGLHSVAFPAISCGVYGYPLLSAAGVALEALKEERERSEKGVEEIHFYLFGEKEMDAWKSVADEKFEKIHSTDRDD